MRRSKAATTLLNQPPLFDSRVGGRALVSRRAEKTAAGAPQVVEEDARRRHRHKDMSCGQVDCAVKPTLREPAQLQLFFCSSADCVYIVDSLRSPGFDFRQRMSFGVGKVEDLPSSLFFT